MSASANATGNKPCRFFRQGHCRFGELCRFSHEPGSQTPSVDNPLVDRHGIQAARSQDQCISTRAPRSRGNRPSSGAPALPRESSSTSGQVGPSASGDRARVKRGEIACHAWKAGSCVKGDRCWFGHDPALQGQERRRREAAAQRAQVEADKRAEEERRLAEAQAADEEARRKAERARLDRLAREEAAREARRAEDEERQRQEAQMRATAEQTRQARLAQEEATRAERDARLAETRSQDAAKTMQQLIQGSIVTFGAGLAIRGVITGFESCTVRIKKLPADAREDEVELLFTQQGIDSACFQIAGMKRTQDGRQEAQVVIDVTSGQVLAAGLDDVEFRDERLELEVGAYNHVGGMGLSTGRDASVLTISWRTPSVRYVSEFPDIGTAERKVRELDGRLCAGHRVKVTMNKPPPGRRVPSYRENSVMINNLPVSVSDVDVVAFAGSSAIRRLQALDYDIDHAMTLLRQHIDRISDHSVRDFTRASAGDHAVAVAVKFGSYEEAQTVHDMLVDQRMPYIGNTKFWLRLPSPMLYNVTIPSEQYNAQRTQWNALAATASDRKACHLSVIPQGPSIRLQVSGSAKEEVGALKVRVESLLTGENVTGWHRALGFSKNGFSRDVYDATGVFLRADWRQQKLRLYGNHDSIERARRMVVAELDRLAALEFTLTLGRQSVSFFIRRAIPALKESFGEDNVRFSASSRKVTITGGEEARHALQCYVDESMSGRHVPSADVSTEARCPVCSDDITNPLQLSCGHLFCEGCMKHLVTSALDADHFPMVCMADNSNCGAPIPLITVQRFLPPTAFSRLSEKAFDSYIATHPREFKYCKTPDCKQLYRGTSQEATTALNCPACFTSICSACDEEPHEGMSCADARLHKDPAEQDRLNQVWMLQQDGRVKKCPSCQVFIEKTEGCNHMSCRCGAHICWRCMGVYTADTIYNHMHQQHGGIHGDDPDPILAVNLREQEEVLQQAAIRRQLDLAREGALRERHLNYQQELRQMEARQQELRRHQEANFIAHENARRLREETARREAERRRQREQNSGWGCIVM